MSAENAVSIISRNEIVREGLRRILTDLSFEVREVVGDIAALRQTSLDDPDTIVLVDASMFEDAVQVCHDLRDLHPKTRIVLMTDDYSIENVGRAFSAGVDGCLVKTIACESLGGALRLIALGEKVFPSQVAESLLDPGWKISGQGWSGNIKDVNLSTREIDILRCLVSGEANKVISRRLDITEATVKVHIKAILRKLRVSNRTQAAIWAMSRGFDQQADGEPQVYQAFSNRQTYSSKVA